MGYDVIGEVHDGSSPLVDGVLGAWSRVSDLDLPYVQAQNTWHAVAMHKVHGPHAKVAMGTSPAT